MIGKNFKHYEILEKLGAGGMGVVYKALDKKLNRQVALKFLPPQLAFNPEMRKRFVIEAQAAAALNHPNITTIHATEEVGDETFIVMEFIEGVELAKKLAQESLTTDEVINYSIQIAEGLKAAHDKGIVHRDIKSANIMLTESGLIKVMDFGLAKQSGQMNLTQMGSTVGTINYMSPEQTRGEEVDHRSDIWSLGVMMYEMLTGSMPFKGKYEQAVIYSILNTEPKEIEEDDEKYKNLFEAIKKCLAKNPDDRYPNAGDLLINLKSLRDGTPIRVSSIAQTSAGVRASDNVLEDQQKTVIYSLPIHRKRNITITSLLVLALLVLAIFKGDELLKFAGVNMTPDEKHIAILPFTTFGDDSSVQAFGAGLVETLTSKLSQLEQFYGKLWVVPAGEIRRNKITTPEDAYNKYAANLIIEGSVQALQKGYRVTINLIDAETKEQIDSRMIDDQLTTVSYLQDEAIIKVAEMLNLELKPESLEKMKKGGTTDPEAYELYVKARGYLTNYEIAENINSAIELLERAVGLDSTFALAHAGLADAYQISYDKSRETGDINKAIQSCKQAMTSDETLIQAKIIMAKLFNLQGQNEFALSELQKALELDPTNWEAYQEKALTFFYLKKNDEAEKSYQKAIAIRPDLWIVYNSLGVFYFREGKYDKAVNQFAKVIDLIPNSALGYKNTASMFAYLDESKEAIRFYEKALSIETDYRTYSNLASMYFQDGNYEEASQTYERILELNDGDYRIWGYLASSYYWTKRQKKKINYANNQAISLAELKLGVNPNDLNTLGSLATYYGMAGNLSKTDSILTILVQSNPADVYLQFLIGQIYEEWMHDRDKALIWIMKALKNGFAINKVRKTLGLKNLITDQKFKEMVGSLP
ncbi:MAG: protein kinase [Bacteroidetes bacterium]|nr:protein kinase [Bacteroidota bacterium]